MRRICVFCGSNTGARPAYRAAAEALGRLLAGRGIGLVYGGSGVGLMGALADAVLGAGGQVTGIIPQALVDEEVAHRTLDDLRVVGSMHERKALMAELSDGFVAMPGGFGTLEEICEAFTWLLLGLHDKPCGLLNVDGYYDHFLHFVGHTTTERFMRPEHHAMLLHATSPEQLLDRMQAFRPVTVRKWIDEP